jgi:hypothetical protein
LPGPWPLSAHEQKIGEEEGMTAKLAVGEPAGETEVIGVTYASS